ncbi:MAG: putative esterase [Kiritimatiellia bacterium]|jgi:predicted esterase
MKSISLTSKLMFTLLTAISFSLAAVAPASAQDASEPGRYRPQGREIARDIGREFDAAIYEVRTYEPTVNVDEFASATIFYPLTLSFAAPSSAAVLVPGYTATQDIYDWWGPALASLGIVVMIIDTNDPRDTFQPRKEAHIAAVEFLKGEINNSESPINGKVDTNKMAIMGHSLGGGAALAAAMELGSEIKAVIPLMPYCCELGESFSGDYSGLTVPTLIFTSSEDTVAPPAGHARALYDSIADSTKKAYVEFAEGTHNLPTNGGTELANQARLTFAWLKLQMDGNAAYAVNFNGDLSEELDAKLAVLETNQ